MAGTDRFTAPPLDASMAAVPLLLPAPVRGLLLLEQKWETRVRTMMGGKIHRATVTDANIGYEGSITLDPDLLEAAGILPYEQVHVLDATNGARLETYAIQGRRGSGEVCINGAAAHLVHPGDIVIIIAYQQLSEEAAHGAAPRHVYVDAQNRIIRTSFGDGLAHNDVRQAVGSR